MEFLWNLVFLAFSAHICSGYINLADVECGQQSVRINPKIRAARVAGGREAFHGEFPWIVSLQYNIGDRNHFCGGFLVNRSTIVTAAHCLVGVSRHRIHVLVGEHVIGETEYPIDSTAYRVASIKEHPEYENEMKRNDIALVHLEQHVEWGPYVQPACLSNQEDDLQDGRLSHVAGWGSTQDSTETATLRTSELAIVSPSSCEKEYKWKPFESQFCAGLGSKDTGACGGDSGSPLMIRDSYEDTVSVVGIHAGGRGCGLDMLPGIYTKVASYISWIQTNVA